MIKNSTEIVLSPYQPSNVDERETLTLDKILKVGVTVLGTSVSFYYCPVFPLVGWSIYLISNKIFKRRDFEIITNKDLETKKGKSKYLKFLKEHSNESSSVKLFGWKAEVKSAAEARKHIHSLMLAIHPDKVNSHEKKLCTELSAEVNSLADDYFKSQKPNILDSCLTVYDDQFASFLKRGQWQLAKKFMKDDSPFACFFEIKEGNFLKAIESASQCELFDIVGVLKTCENHKEMTLQELMNSLNDLQVLKEVFCKRLNISSLQDITPYSLYLSIAECYQESLEFAVEYQQYMRLAIRNCLCLEIKKSLIVELKMHLYGFCQDAKVNIERCIFEEMGLICESFKEYAPSTLADLMDVYLQDRTLKNLQNIIDDTEKILRKEYFGSRCIPSFIKGYADSYLAYSEDELTKLSQGLNLLKGMQSYLRGDFRDATLYFERGEHFLFHALSKLGLKNFQGALTSFSKLSLEDPFIEECSFWAMNLYDTCEDALQVPTHYLLQKIDDFQIKILRARIKTII